MRSPLLILTSLIACSCRQISLRTDSMCTMRKTRSDCIDGYDENGCVWSGVHDRCVRVSQEICQSSGAFPTCSPFKTHEPWAGARLFSIMDASFPSLKRAVDVNAYDIRAVVNKLMIDHAPLSAECDAFEGSAQILVSNGVGLFFGSDSGPADFCTRYGCCKADVFDKTRPCTDQTGSPNIGLSVSTRLDGFVVSLPSYSLCQSFVSQGPKCKWFVKKLGVFRVLPLKHLCRAGFWSGGLDIAKRAQLLKRLDEKFSFGYTDPACILNGGLMHCPKI